MKFHKTLILMTAICIPCCFLFFYLLDRNSPENDRGLYMALGWIGYLGMLTFIIPGTISTETRREWFSKPYAAGTLLVLLGNVFGAIVADYIAYTLMK